jgi:hypothetical protein
MKQKELSFWLKFIIVGIAVCGAIVYAAALPYLTYNVSMAYFDEPVMMSASLWYRGLSWVDITQKAMEIAAYIGLGGRIIPFDGGKLWIKRGTPFAQRMSDENEQIRRIYLNVEVEYFTSL